jgi:hypothetical protein
MSAGRSNADPTPAGLRAQVTLKDLTSAPPALESPVSAKFEREDKTHAPLAETSNQGKRKFEGAFQGARTSDKGMVARAFPGVANADAAASNTVSRSTPFPALANATGLVLTRKVRFWVPYFSSLLLSETTHPRSCIRKGWEDEFCGCPHASVKELHALLGRLGEDACLFPKLTEDLVGKCTFERFLEAGNVNPEAFVVCYAPSHTPADAFITMPCGEIRYIEIKVSFASFSGKADRKLAYYNVGLRRNTLNEGHQLVGFCIRQPTQPRIRLYDELQSLIQTEPTQKKWGPVVFDDDLSKLAGRLLVITHDNADILPLWLTIVDPATSLRASHETREYSILEYDGTEARQIDILARVGLTPAVIERLREIPEDEYQRRREAFLHMIDEDKRKDFFHNQAQYRDIARQLKGPFLGPDLQGKLGSIAKLTAVGFPMESVAVDLRRQNRDVEKKTDALLKWKGHELKMECKALTTMVSEIREGCFATPYIRAQSFEGQFNEDQNHLVYIIANPESLRRDIGLDVQAIARSAGKRVPPLNLDWLNGGFSYTCHFLIPTSAITGSVIQKCWKKIMLHDTVDWMMDYKLETKEPARLTRVLDIAAKVDGAVPLRIQGLKMPYIDISNYIEKWLAAIPRGSPNHIDACRVCIAFCAHVEEQQEEGRTFQRSANIPRQRFIAARQIRDCLFRCYNGNVEAFVSDGNRPNTKWYDHLGGCRKDGACGHKKNLMQDRRFKANGPS